MGNRLALVLPPWHCGTNFSAGLRTGPARLSTRRPPAATCTPSPLTPQNRVREASGVRAAVHRALWEGNELVPPDLIIETVDHSDVAVGHRVHRQSSSFRRVTDTRAVMDSAEPTRISASGGSRARIPAS